MAVTEAAPLQTQLGHSVVGAGRVVAPLGHRRQFGEVDPQVGDLPQLCRERRARRKREEVGGKGEKKKENLDTESPRAA